MLDAQRSDPLVNDVYAERFMGEEGKSVFEQFRHMAVPIGAHQVRCYLIDELVRARLAADVNVRVVLVGAGFDSRAFRLQGGRWVEIDEKAVIERKEAVAPAATCPNPLERVSIDFARELLAEKLAPYATDTPTVVICEGVSMYLEPQQVEALAAALRTAFPRHRLFVDVMNRRFAVRYAREMSEVLASIGTGFRGLEDDPLGRLEHLGYRCRSSDSVVARALALKRVPMPSFMAYFLWLRPTLRDGYRVAALEFGM
jgi:methyltransferase (TIGR00027 family)